MNPVSRGIRNAFRNYTRTISIVVIIGLSIGLGLSMLVARQAVSAKINSVESNVGTSISISPAGVRGFEGGGNPLTESQLASLTKLDHVVSLSESLSDRLTTSDTNLTSAISAGSLGQRFAQNSGSTVTAPSGTFGGSFLTSFTPPILVDGTNNPTDLSDTIGGGSFKLDSGSLYASNSAANVALVGSSLATKNNLKTGSTFTAYSQTITVDGIFSSGNTFSNNQIIMPLSTVQTLSSQVNDLTSATVTVDSLNNVQSVTNAITKQLGSSADVTNEIDEASNTVAPLKNIRTIAIYSLVGAILAGAVIIFLIMIMIVRERRREIGVLKAIGASNLKVMWQFMSEAITLTLLGAIIGILIGVAAANPITKLLVNNSTPSTVQAISTSQSPGGGTFRAVRSNNSNFSFGPQSTRGSFRGVRNSFNNIHAIVGWSIIGYGILAALVIAIIGSAAASLLIAKVRPAEVMRAE